MKEHKKLKIFGIIVLSIIAVMVLINILENFEFDREITKLANNGVL